MDSLNEMALAVILLIRLGSIMRFVYCMIRMSAAEDEAEKYKNRSKNTIIFYIIAESIWQIKDIIMFYYGG